MQCLIFLNEIYEKLRRKFVKGVNVVEKCNNKITFERDCEKTRITAANKPANSIETVFAVNVGNNYEINLVKK